MRIFPLFLSSLLVSASAANVRSSQDVGDWKPIKNLRDPHVLEIARFAVAEHNKEADVVLKLGRVVRGEIQVASGINYRLVIQAASARGGDNEYVAVVWEKSWQNFRRLTSFRPLEP
ncbi:hypothetical protein HPP92_005809 [Vanilla planifolia]|uniref:Cystatin domain-containing protein n=1 Tax=Vanilla planifolia TaxID=51239 RepID=A0A835VF84_VANPL|nr:hypothetical protein HPP92_005809 [Vanilla planifolia]